MTLRHPDPPTERDLAALADGSLAGRRRMRVERAVADSPELRAKLRDQRRALAAVRTLERDRAPETLRARVTERARPPRRPVRRAGALAFAGAGAIAAALVVALGGSPAGTPTVADAAALATRTPVASVPAAARGAATLPRPRGAGLPFPSWRDRFGWRAIGSREDRVDGRSATTVFYRRGTQVVAYTIVDGRPLRLGSPARISVRDGTTLRSFAIGGRTAVTWLRDGHTCVLSGSRTAAATLLRLAA